jgi:hypothetical protein
VDGALETVEHMRLAAHFHFETFVVGVTAHFTGGGLFTQHIFAFIHLDLFPKHK